MPGALNITYLQNKHDANSNGKNKFGFYALLDTPHANTIPKNCHSKFLRAGVVHSLGTSGKWRLLRLRREATPGSQ
jgi:hypothetical protein